MPPVHTLFRWRVLILAWLIMWVASVPLFHLHIPDTTDQWSTVMSGGAHTVFTPDLPGEFPRHFTDHNQGRSAHFSLPEVNSPELALAPFSEKLEDRKTKTLDIHGAPSNFFPTRLLSSPVLEFPGACRNAHLYQACPPSRAPPHNIPA